MGYAHQLWQTLDCVLSHVQDQVLEPCCIRPCTPCAAGVVYDEKFYMISPNDDSTPDAMRVYDFAQQEWALWELSVKPPAALNVLLGVYQDQLIQYGGKHKQHLPIHV